MGSLGGLGSERFEGTVVPQAISKGSRGSGAANRQLRTDRAL
jgi:hypothetical protein